MFKLLISSLIELLHDEFGKPGFDYNVIVGLETRGFIIGPPIAMALGLPFVPVRKEGKLPGECVKEGYTKEYGKDCCEIQKKALHPTDKVIIFDDLLATGGTLKAAENLIKACGGPTLVGHMLVYELIALKGREKLSAKTVSFIRC